MINRTLNQDFQEMVADYFLRVKIILGLTCLSLLLFFHYFQLAGGGAPVIIFPFLLSLVVWALYFVVRARRPAWILPYNAVVLWMDVLAATVALHYFGGIYSMIWSAAYLLLIAFSSVFLSRRGRTLFAMHVLVAYGVLCQLEHAGMIPRHNIFRIPSSSGMDLFIWSSTSLILVAAAVLANRLGEALGRLETFASLGRLSTELAHEIRTPLQIIQGMLRRIKANEEAKQEIQAQTERIARFVQEILALGREEPSRVVSLPVRDIVDQAITQILKAMPLRPGIRVEKDFCEEELWTEGDADQLIKAFSNLVRNGIDSMDGGGRLLIRVVRYGFEWLQVDIQDTGIGMERAEFDRIFEPFYTTKAGRRGIGLGLAIAKKFIEANNGRIEVDSRPGEGSLFTVRLPLAAPPEAPSAIDKGRRGLIA